METRKGVITKPRVITFRGGKTTMKTMKTETAKALPSLWFVSEGGLGGEISGQQNEAIGSGVGLMTPLGGNRRNLG